MEGTYGLRNITTALPDKLKQYLEAQYHIWDESLVKERRRLLDQIGTTFAEPYLEATPAYVPGNTYAELDIPEEVSSLLTLASNKATTGIPAKPYLHQAKALECFFSESRELVISTGTGSGKTESFLMPILGSLAIEKSIRPISYGLTATRALLLYPMNALVNDQMSRLRRLLGSDTVANALLKPDGFRPTFGMYTSRTPYPGLRDARRTQDVVGAWIDHFFTEYAEQRESLTAEGKWPAKDLVQFRQTFTTSKNDSELLTRHEMHDRSPDVLVTNYSMLEYMLLRPVDASIFDKTRDWLAYDKNNNFVIVLDEAHLYQGAQGTEVALLLRRLLSRLRVSRERVKFILTSASLASGENAEEIVQGFAAQLTGANDPRRFAYIEGKLARPVCGRAANASEANAFATLDVDSFLSVDVDFQKAKSGALTLAHALGVRLGEPNNPVELRESVYQALSGNEVANELARLIMGNPRRVADLALALFPTDCDRVAALDGLLAVCAFARRSTDGRPLLPMRAHLLFRGLSGVFACINPFCTGRQDTHSSQLLGRLYARPRKHCECGGRVYELLTHRDCGAAFLRAYYRPGEPTFLWHEPSTGQSGQGQTLTEVHLLVEYERDQAGGFDRVWLNIKTGQLAIRDPGVPSAYLELRRPTSGSVLIAGRNVVTFDCECPVCLGTWNDRKRPKIMDLATKGEDPFAHLIAVQVKLQPPSRAVSRDTPNAGRKSLLFSDGRQKAARLARDIPRVIEQDSFRQVILMAADRLLARNREARVNDSALYVSFVSVVSEKMLSFFDGTDAELLKGHLFEYEDKSSYGGSLDAALSDPWEPISPQAFRMNVMRVLGNRFYSLYALGLGYVHPRKSVRGAIKARAEILQLSDVDLEALTVVWMQGMLQHFALYSRAPYVTRRSRELAAGYPVTQAGSRSGFSRKQKSHFRQYFDVASLEAIFSQSLTEQGDASDLRLLMPDKLCVAPAIKHEWFRCGACTYLAPYVFRNSCASCGSNRVIPVAPGGDVYLRARKAFWRDPVERVLMGIESPMTLDVQEHTAQLGYRDLGDLEATTESYERRFRDILIKRESGIDVLSCTTTMEVGIDIGSLVAVGLRNMPPSRHNYQQRAGRAGRRGSSVSTVITFAQNNAHDSFLFEHPEELIAGAPRLTGLDIDNPALVKRHAYAELLQEYFTDSVVRRSGGNIFASLGGTVQFFSSNGDGSLTALASWLRNDPGGASALSRVHSWIPAGCHVTADNCRDLLLSDLEGLRPAATGVLPKGEDQLIEFLFARGILPAYAFPRDLVALQIEQLDAQQQVQILERPQQGANIALSEYAPGRLVVVNKQTYRIGAVTADLPSTEVNRARPLFARPSQYLQCANCLYTADPSIGTPGSACPVCTISLIQLVTVIQPEVVWPEGRRPIDELDDDQTITDTTVAQLPVPASTDAFEADEPFGPAARLLHGRLVPLIIMNRGELSANGPTGFQICDQCGHTALGGQPFINPHDRHYFVARRGQPIPRTCNGVARTVYLGYEFRTDVLLLRTPLISPFIQDLDIRATWPPLRSALNSLANALALTAASELDVDPRELQCGYRIQRSAGGAGLAEVYIYDTLAGGAGYSRLVGNNFEKVFASLQQRLSGCDCDTSCTKCLRTYSNRMTHESLDRFLALDLATYFKSRIAPPLFGANQQERILSPVRSVMELEGWMVQSNSDGGFEAKRGNRNARIYAAPSLLDPQAYPSHFAGATVFTAFEIEKDLPSCIGNLPV